MTENSTSPSERGKNKIWGRIGWTGMAILPGLVSLVVQILVAFAVILLVAVMAAVKGGLSGVTDPSLLTEQIVNAGMNSMGLIVLLYQVFGLLLFGLWYYFGCGRPRPGKIRRVFSGRAFPVTVLVGVFMCIGATAFLSAAQYVAPNVVEQYEELVEMAGLGTDLWAILASVIIAPVGEEILCRGITFHYAQKAVADMQNRRAAFWIANGMQALMFGIIHGNLIQGTYAFALGLGLGWLRWRYRSLYPSMLAHFVVNFSSTFWLGYLFYVLPESLPVYVLVMLISVGCVCALIRWDRAEA